VRAGKEAVFVVVAMPRSGACKFRFQASESAKLRLESGKRDVSRRRGLRVGGDSGPYLYSGPLRMTHPPVWNPGTLDLPVELSSLPGTVQ
jgi:hypothetical protein